MIGSVARRVRGAHSEPEKVRTILVVLVVLAAIAAGWFGWSWWSAAHDDGLELATKRDTVLRVATESLDTLNTVDYHTAKQDIAQWLAVSTGRFGAELADKRKEQIQQVKKAEIVAKATVVNAAVTKLHPRKKTARVMAVLDIDVQGKGQGKQARHNLVEAQLTLVKNTWKIKSVQAAG